MTNRKLNLKCETLQVLTERTLAVVVGGAAAAQAEGQQFSRLVTPTAKCIISCFCTVPRD